MANSRNEIAMSSIQKNQDDIEEAEATTSFIVSQNDERWGSIQIPLKPITIYIMATWILTPKSEWKVLFH